MKACFHSVRVTTQQRLNTARLAARLDERNEFRQIPRGNREEPLFIFCHSRESGNPDFLKELRIWIPTYTGNERERVLIYQA